MIEGCRKQNRQSQEQLYRHCYADMIKVCCRYARDLDEAGAFYNEAMLKVFTNIGQYKGSGEPMAWVRRVMVNTCIDHCRSQVKFATNQLDDDERELAIIPEVYNRLSANDVMQLLDTLPVNTGLVFKLFVLEGFKHEEIGGLLGISRGTSKWHLNEARRLLKEQLDSTLKKEIYSNAY